MSTFREVAVPCPRCGVETVRNLVVSLNAPRVPAIVAAILEDRFQRFECPACSAPYVADGPFIYVDMDRGEGPSHWIGVFPRIWEGRWRALESEPAGAFTRSIVEHAPRFVQRSASDFIVRAVFGLHALRDKLVCLHAGLDDAALEVLKLDLMRGAGGLAFDPRGRPSLRRVDDESLHLVAETPEGTLELTVPRARLEAIGSDRAAWAAGFAAVSGGPYVDVGRLLVNGDEVERAV